MRISKPTPPTMARKLGSVTRWMMILLSMSVVLRLLHDSQTMVPEPRQLMNYHELAFAKRAAAPPPPQHSGTIIPPAVVRKAENTALRPPVLLPAKKLPPTTTPPTTKPPTTKATLTQVLAPGTLDADEVGLAMALRSSAYEPQKNERDSGDKTTTVKKTETVSTSSAFKQYAEEVNLSSSSPVQAENAGTNNTGSTAPRTLSRNSDSVLPSTQAVTKTVFPITEGNTPLVDDGLFFVVADSRSGADALMDMLDKHHDDMCASGGFPGATFLPDTMPWLDHTSTEMGCTAAFLRDSLEQIAKTPSRCDADSSIAADDALQPHLPRVCHLWNNLKLHEAEGYSHEAVIRVLLQAIATGDDKATGCSCSAHHKGFKVGADWMNEGKNMPVFPAAAGRKVVRLTRRNYWERYMSFVLAAKTSQWSIKSHPDKQKQWEAFSDIELAVDVNEMLAQFDMFTRDDARTDALIKEHASSVLWVDHMQWRSDPQAVMKEISTFLGLPVAKAEEVVRVPDWPMGSHIISKVSNGPQVAEIIEAKGHGDWIGKGEYVPIQWIIVDENGADNLRTPGAPDGIHLQLARSNEELVKLLAAVPPDAATVVSDAGGSLNPHIRTIPLMYEALGVFRARLAELNGVVVQERIHTVTETSRQLVGSLGSQLSAGTAAALLGSLRGNRVSAHEDNARKFFGTRFEGVPGKIACLQESHHVFTSGDDIPLFVYNTPNCYEPPIQYPLWNDGKGIDSKPIFNHVQTLLVQNRSLADIDRHFGREILYVVNKTGLFASAVKRDKYRVVPTESFLVDAVHRLGEENQRWPSLRKAVNENGFGYFGWYGDWKGCNFHNAEDGGSVPLLTTCAATACNYSFPSPAYMTILHAQPDATHWLQVLGRFVRDFPHEKQIRKVVWRGGLTENNPAMVRDSARWRVMKAVHELENQSDKDLFDVGLTGIPEFITAQIDIDAAEVGGLANGISSMNDFQQYSAVLDMDGNSWSSRFSTLLCYNSLAIKVEPAYADHFFFDLVPWKHYVPVRSDLSDLVENVRFILDPANAGIAEDMVASANQWCMDRLTRTALIEDQLILWDRYVAGLDQGDPSWPAAWEDVIHSKLISQEFIPLVN